MLVPGIYLMSSGGDCIWREFCLYEIEMPTVCLNSGKTVFCLSWVTGTSRSLRQNLPTFDYGLWIKRLPSKVFLFFFLPKHVCLISLSLVKQLILNCLKCLEVQLCIWDGVQLDKAWPPSCRGRVMGIRIEGLGPVDILTASLVSVPTFLPFWKLELRFACLVFRHQVMYYSGDLASFRDGWN